MIRLVWFVAAAARDLLTLALLAMVRCYQVFVSPWIPNACRYRPTCSVYAVQAIRKYGPLRGVVMAALRVARCHPWSHGGWDPP